MNVVNQSEPQSSCVSTSNLPTTLTAKQRYEKSEKGKERSRRRDALRRAQRHLDKMARNRNRFIDRFGSYCGHPSESAGKTRGVLDTSLTPISNVDSLLKKFRRSMMRVNLLYPHWRYASTPSAGLAESVDSRWNDQPIAYPEVVHSTVGPLEIQKRDLALIPARRPRVSMRINLIRLSRFVNAKKPEPTIPVAPVVRDKPLSILFPYDEPIFALPASARSDWKEQIRNSRETAPVIGGELPEQWRSKSSKFGSGEVGEKSRTPRTRRFGRLA